MINFRSKLHRDLLGYYFKNPHAEHYLRELSRMLSFDVAHLSQELGKFVRDGLFVARTSGREKFFRLNQAHPLASELGVILKVLGSIEKK